MSANRLEVRKVGQRGGKFRVHVDGVDFDVTVKTDEPLSMPIEKVTVDGQVFAVEADKSSISVMPAGSSKAIRFRTDEEDVADQAALAMSILVGIGVVSALLGIAGAGYVVGTKLGELAKKAGKAGKTFKCNAAKCEVVIVPASGGDKEGD